MRFSLVTHLVLLAPYRACASQATSTNPPPDVIATTPTAVSVATHTISSSDPSPNTNIGNNQGQKNSRIPTIIPKPPTLLKWSDLQHLKAKFPKFPKPTSKSPSNLLPSALNPFQGHTSKAPELPASHKASELPTSHKASEVSASHKAQELSASHKAPELPTSHKASEVSASHKAQELPASRKATATHKIPHLSASHKTAVTDKIQDHFSALSAELHSKISDSLPSLPTTLPSVPTPSSFMPPCIGSKTCGDSEDHNKKDGSGSSGSPHSLSLQHAVKLAAAFGSLAIVVVVMGLL